MVVFMQGIMLMAATPNIILQVSEATGAPQVTMLVP